MAARWTTPDAVLVEVAGTLVPGRALDVGCGDGHDSVWLARQGWSVSAIDTSRPVVANVRKLAAEARLDVTAKRMDVTALDAQQEYDLVSICYMHLPRGDREAMLRNAARALKLGGTLLFRSFEAGIADAPFDRALLPTRDDVVGELESKLVIKRAHVADEFFPYMKKVMRLLTVVADRPPVDEGMNGVRLPSGPTKHGIR